MDAVSCETVAQSLPAVASGVLSLRYLSFDQATTGWMREIRGMSAQSELDWGREPETFEVQHVTVDRRFTLTANLATSADARLII